MSEIIVSFTSYPARIMTIDKVLDTIIEQTVLPDKIILYLSSSEFEDFKDMPNLEKYKKYGFEIHWHKENLKSHKKWFYAFQEYPEDIIITIDDDILYCNTALENLLKYHKIFPKAVIARRAHLITCNADNSIALYDDWYGECSVYVGIPRMDLVATGNAGILYPPNIFEKETFNKDTFIEKTPYADDIWLKVMEVYSGTPVVLAERTWEDDVLLEHQIHCLYEDYNKDGGNDKQFIQLLNHSTYNKDRKKLEARIFSEGRIFCSDVNELKQQELEKTIEELAVKIQQNNQALIYGAGVMGKRVYKLLKNKKFNQIKAFIVNNITTNPDFILDIPVKYYKEFIDSYEKIVIALLDKKESNNVYIQLIKDGVSNERIILLNTLEKEGLMKQGGIFDSQEYWENRYLEGGNSGAGSYHRLANFKAKVVNEFVKKNNINRVIEWGCGDGNQLSLAKYSKYIGYDVSEQAISICQKKFAEDQTKVFKYCGSKDFVNDIKADLSISLDVIYHLVEDDVYHLYMNRLFQSSQNMFVFIHAIMKKHMRHMLDAESLQIILNKILKNGN